MDAELLLHVLGAADLVSFILPAHLPMNEAMIDSRGRVLMPSASDRWLARGVLWGLSWLRRLSAKYEWFS